MHERLHLHRRLLADIKAHEGSAIEITGIMKKGQYGPDGVNIGGGVRVGPGPAPNGGMGVNMTTRQSFIDVEAWRPIDGECRSR
jgi:hypothetical protein